MAGGTQPEKGIPELLNEIRERLEQGYHAMKIKVGGATIPEDVKRVEAALKVVAGSRNLAVDANGAFDRSRALAYAEALAPFKLRWFEAHRSARLRVASAEVTANYEARSAAAKSLLHQDVENLVRFGGLRSDRDILQIDVPQSYGIVQFSRTLAMLEGRGWRRSAIFPHGGNQMTLHIVGGFGLGGCEAYPGVFGVFAGFADDARMEDGYLELPDRPGIGFEAQNGLCE